MNFNWLIMIFILNEVSGLKKCPHDCTCNLDKQSRLQLLCIKGSIVTFPHNLIDPEVQVIIIKGPRNYITLPTPLTHLTKLEVFRIIDSNLSTIGKNSFWGVPSLRILDFSKNNLTGISEDNFRGQDNLIELDLSKNKIYKVPSLVFRYLKSLKTLSLADNSLDVLSDRPFFMLMGLKLLDLSGNMLQDLPPDVFKDVQELRIFKCRRCQLKNINPQIYNLIRHLHELDLGDNQFKYLVSDEFNDLKKLTNLKLDGNQLSVVVDNIFLNQKGLQYLDVSRNRLAKITNFAFHNLTNLTFLDLSYNKLTRLEVASILPLIKLDTLNISGNTQMDLNEIRPTLQTLLALSTLAIADMGSLPIGLLVPLGHLTSLNLSGNHLDFVILQILNPVFNLKILDLSRNQLKGIDDNFAVRLKNIEDVRLENNPLICDRCHMGPLIDRAQTLKWDPPPTCFLPESLRGYPINQLDLIKIENCIDWIIDEDHDAASTSHNILDQGDVGTLIVFGGIVIILVGGVLFTTVMCFIRIEGRRNIGRNQEHISKNTNIQDDTGKSFNMQLQHQHQSVDEKTFKFPLKTSVCTIDDICSIPPPPPPPNVKAILSKDDFD